MAVSHYNYDVLVVGAGHAGTEAALAAARLGARCCLLTTNVDSVAQMSCNPAIGGVAKGQIVREIDALGGVMGQAIDATGIQFRLLNRRKGPAMHSPRAQADKKAYQQFVKLQVEEQENLDLRQEVVEDLLVETQSVAVKDAGRQIAGDANPASPYSPSVVAGGRQFLQGMTGWDESGYPAGDIKAQTRLAGWTAGRQSMRHAGRRPGKAHAPWSWVPQPEMKRGRGKEKQASRKISLGG